jgi:hypothetical protein
MGLCFWRISNFSKYLDVCSRTECCRERYATICVHVPSYDCYWVIIRGYVVDHFNENILIYGVISFVVLALISIFTLAKGLNNPKVTCEN